MDSHTARSLGAALIAAALAACGAGDPAASGPVVHDSAGITIVENAAPLWREREGWEVDPEPAVDIGVLEGDPVYQLFRVRGAARLADGRIVVANGGTHELRFYDAEGRFLEAAGREGEGPGEFRRLGGVFPIGDSLYVHDVQLDRVSVFDARGAFGRSFRLEPGAGGAVGTAVGVFGDGSLLVRGARVFRSGEVISGVVADSLAHYRYDRNGAILDSVGAWPMPSRYVRADGRSVSVTEAAFGLPSAIVVHGDHVYFGRGERYEIERYAGDGRLDRLVRRAGRPLRVTPEDIARYEETELAEANEIFRPILERALAEMPMPEAMPAYRDVRVDADGFLWVEDYRRPGDDRPRWSVFDPDGRWLGAVATPPGLEIREIGRDHLLGVWEDEFEVEHVRLHRLIRPGESDRVATAARGSGGSAP